MCVQNKTQGAEIPASNGEQYDYDACDVLSAGHAIHMEETYFNIEDVIGFDALYDSMCKCVRGVIWKDSVMAFRLHAIDRTMNLSEQLHNGTYRPAPMYKFRITSPKPREIASVSFRDRVYQRSLNDNAVYPAMTNGFIYDNYACQKNKGTDAARERLKDFLHRYYRKHGATGYVAQFDVHGYYPTMDHDVTERAFQRKLPPEIFKRVQKVLHSQYDGDTGYYAGSQLIQIAGISVLDGMDHFIKEKLRAKFYIRYMDDFLIISHDREYLESCMRAIVAYLTGIKFTINDKKTKIFSLSKGIEFLGFKYTLTGTGKVYMNIKPGNVKRQRRKLRRLVNKSKKGMISKDKVNESYAAWRNHASKGNNWKLLQRMDKYYKDLWR